MDSRGSELSTAQVVFEILGFAAKKIVERGFVPDINDSVWIELQLGPVITSGFTFISYSLHLRWDFAYNSLWTFYALAGDGGNIAPSSLGNRFESYFRFGMGAIYTFSPNLNLRFEASHESIAGGVTFVL